MTDQTATADPGLYEFERVEPDPVTFEVIRHRLQTINDEQAIALKAVSGSPIVTEADDYNTGLYRADGELVAMGRTVIYHAASMSVMVGHILEDCFEDPGINEGDAFLVNSPWKGALHAADMAIIEPIFYEGLRIGWAGATAHQLDIGGMNHGGFMPRAHDVYQEGLLIPPLKIVDGGVTRTDVWRMITGMSRLGEALSLNFRGMIAANRVGANGVLQLIDRYGVDVVLSTMDGLLDLSEQKVRGRLAQLPDGHFKAQSFLDHDGHENKLYRVAVTMSKRGDGLTFDYSESSGQAHGFINSTRTGMIAGTYAGVLPILAYDVPWNAGVFRAIEVEAPDGKVVTAMPPAPCSQAPLGAIWLAEIVSTEAMSKLVATSADFVSEGQASPAGAVDMFNPSGIDQYGQYSGWLLLDNMMTGGGAYAHRDGLNPQGHRCITSVRVPNVESQELISPLLYLYRRLQQDAGGAGRHRGGESATAGFALHDAHWLNAVVAGHGFESPNSRGLFGGYPAACNSRLVVRNSSFREQLTEGRIPTTVDELEGDVEETPAKAEIHLGGSDVVLISPQAGGGWGDPLDRSPAAVADDVRMRWVSSAAASDLYGVVLTDDGSVDEDATAARRAAIVDERRSWPVNNSYEAAIVDDNEPILIGEWMALRQAGDSLATTCACGFVFCPTSDNWKHYAATKVATEADLGPGIKLHEELEVRLYACPNCGRLLDVEVAKHDDEPLFDLELTS